MLTYSTHATLTHTPTDTHNSHKLGKQASNSQSSSATQWLTFEDESPDVVLHIKRFEDWIRRLYRPTDDEVRQCAQTRSPHFLDTIRQILIENHLPQN